MVSPYTLVMIQKEDISRLENKQTEEQEKQEDMESMPSALCWARDHFN